MHCHPDLNIFQVSMSSRSWRLLELVLAVANHYIYYTVFVSLSIMLNVCVDTLTSLCNISVRASYFRKSQKRKKIFLQLTRENGQIGKYRQTNNRIQDMYFPFPKVDNIIFLIAPLNNIVTHLDNTH